MQIRKTFCFGLAAALVLAATPTVAQVYSWKDAATGRTKISNIAPRWYSHGDVGSGPRVIATTGGKVIDDTGLPYEKRVLLWDKPKDDADKLRMETQQRSAAAQATAPESGAMAANSPRADHTATR